MKKTKIMAVITAAAMILPSFADVPFAQLSPLTVTAQAASAEWTGSFATDFTGGLGTEEEPFLISTAEQLALLANELNNKSTQFDGVYFKLINDITLNNGLTAADKPIEWTPIGYSGYAFQGIFDGNGYSIIGMHLTTNADYRGLFGYLGSNAVVKNLTMKGGLIADADESTGNIAGYNAGTISNCVNYNSIDCHIYATIGGICGYNGGTVENCKNYGEFTVSGSYDNCGGIVGYSSNSGEITNCSNYGSITSNIPDTGGIVGNIAGSTVLSDCINYGEISSTNSCCGGIVGVVYSSTVEDCGNVAAINGNGRYGGAIGYTESGTILNCYNTAKVTGSVDGGGVIGYAYERNTITGCYNTGAVTANYTPGGLIGYANGYSSSWRSDITACYNTGTVTGLGSEISRTGGLIGWSEYANIKTSYNHGAVTGSGPRVGGFIGENAYSIITNCYNAGTTTGKADYTGGYVGYVNGNIYMTSCYNTGAVKGISYVGGLWSVFVNSGSNATVTDCYNAGAVSGSGTNIYPIGEVPTTAAINTTYYDKDVCTVSHYSNSKFAKTSEQMTATTVINDLGFSNDDWIKKANTSSILYYPNLASISNDNPYTLKAIPAPTVTVTTGNGAANLSWNAVSGATSYRVYRSATATGTKTLLKGVAGTSYVDTTVTAGTTYYYFVTAYNSNVDKASPFSATKTIKITALSAPTITESVTAANKVTLSWSKVTGATSYRVYRATSSTGTKTLLKGVAATSYVDTTAKTGSTYYYYVTAYSSVSGKASAYSAAKAVKVTALGAPTISSISTSGKNVTLKWNAVSGATSYRVYRATSATGTKTLLKGVSTTSYTDTVSANGTYYYFVTSYNSNTAEQSAYSSYKSAKVATISAPTISSISASGKNVTLKWSAVSGATSYRVYRATSATGTKTLLKGVATTSYTDTVSANGTYYYFVAAYSSSTSALSAYSAAKSVKVATISAPTISSISASGKNVTLKWSAVSGATSYRVYRATSATGTKTLLKGVATTSYTDTVSANGTYYYFVVAYNSSTSALSAYSAGKSVKVSALTAPVISSISASNKSVTLKWNAVSGATSYRVYRATSATGTKTLLKGVATTSYTDTVSAAGTYYYFVTAYNSSTAVQSAYSAVKSVKVSSLAAPTISSISASGMNVTLKWNAVSGATSYRVYRATSATGTKTLLKGVSATSFTDTVSASGTYYYFVTAYNSNTADQSSYSAHRGVIV